MSGLRLTILGSFRATHEPDGEIALPTRKARVLLAYLALAHDRPVPRERLLGLLWSTRSEEQARNSLRQALSALRKSLNGSGRSLLDADRESVSLDTNNVDVDASEFEALISLGQPDALAQAIDCYRGEFLDGIRVQDPAGDEWIAHERNRFAAMAADALETLCRSNVDTRRWDQAASSARRLIEIDPLRECAWRTLMRMHAATGHRTEALKVYAQCRGLLARELGAPPEPETEQLHACIRDNNAGSASASAGIAAPAETPVRTGRPSIVVLPFRDTGPDAAEDWFADGLVEDIVTKLTRYRELFVISEESSLGFGRKGENPGEFARELGVQFVLQGGIRRSAQRLRITARLLDVESGGHLWTETFDRQRGDVLALQDEIAGRVAMTLAGHIEEAGLRRAAVRRIEDLTGYDLYLRAKAGYGSYEQQQNLEARQLLEEATSRDPGFAGAWTDLAWALLFEFESHWSGDSEAALNRAIECGRKAIALDEAGAQAHLALANGYLYRRNYATAERHLIRAGELNPDHYGVHCMRAWSLTLRGQPGEAITSARDAMRVNPLQAGTCLYVMALAHYLEERHEDARDALIQIPEGSSDSQALLAACYGLLGNRDRMYAVAAEVLREAGDTWSVADWDRRYPFVRDRDRQRFLEAMRLVGMVGGESASSPVAGAETAESSASTVGGIRSGGTDATHMSKENSTEVTPKTELSLPDQPSIAVLPFTNRSGDPSQDIFADGLTDEIITGLAKMPGLFVVASHSTMTYKGRQIDVRDVGREQGVRYVLEGGIRMAGDDIRVTAQLIDATTGLHVWAERFERKRRDLLAVQDEITHNVVVELQIKLVAGERARPWAAGTRNLEAWELVTRAKPLIEAHVRDHCMEARPLLERALELDPQYSTALQMLGWIRWEEAYWGWVSTPDDALRKAYELAQKALATELPDPHAWSLLGFIHLQRREPEAAIAMIEQALERLPSNSGAAALLADALITIGRVSEGIQRMQRAIRLCPIPPAWYLSLLGAGFHLTGANEKAVPHLRDAVEKEPESALSHLWLASALVETGDLAKAGSIASNIFGIDPTLSIGRWLDNSVFDPAHRQRVRDNLIAAGIAEEHFAAEATR